MRNAQGLHARADVWSFHRGSAAPQPPGASNAPRQARAPAAPSLRLKAPRAPRFPSGAALSCWHRGSPPPRGPGNTSALSSALTTTGGRPRATRTRSESLPSNSAASSGFSSMARRSASCDGPKGPPRPPQHTHAHMRQVTSVCVCWSQAGSSTTRTPCQRLTHRLNVANVVLAALAPAGALALLLVAPAVKRARPLLAERPAHHHGRVLVRAVLVVAVLRRFSAGARTSAHTACVTRRVEHRGAPERAEALLLWACAIPQVRPPTPAACRCPACAHTAAGTWARAAGSSGCGPPCAATACVFGMHARAKRPPCAHAAAGACAAAWGRRAPATQRCLLRRPPWRHHRRPGPSASESRPARATPGSPHTGPPCR